MSYFVILTCRDSASTIEAALDSLFSQTVQPAYVIAVDDGSTDDTPALLKSWQGRHESLFVITNPDLGYDIGRVVQNWNKALAYAAQCGRAEYYMISTDDMLYSRNYVEKLLAEMERDKELVITSGAAGRRRTEMPRGAGRVVRSDFFAGPYPERMGYESWILHRAMIEGKKVRVMPQATAEHVRALGANHHFYEFGASMRTLGYHPLFVLGRFLQYLLTGVPIGRVGALRMLYHYLTFKPEMHGYRSVFDAEFTSKVAALQMARIKRALSGKT